MRFRILLLGLVTLIMAGLPASAADPIVGNWRLNKAKSQTTGEMPQSYLCVFSETAGGAIKFTGTVVDAKGQKAEYGWESKRDGKPVPITGSQEADSVTISVSQNGYVGSYATSKAGKTVNRGKALIAKDGQTMTWEGTSTTPEGTTAKYKFVFDRQ